MDSSKLDSLLRERSRRGANFPRIAILIVSEKPTKKLAATLERLRESLRPVIEEIFVCDDFSSNEAYQRGARLLKTVGWGEKLRLHRITRHHGYGAHQKIAFAYALEKGFDYVVLLHGDGLYAPEALADLIWPAVCEGREVVFGSRFLTKGPLTTRRLAIRALTWLQNKILGTKLSDYHCGYRLYATSVLKRIPFRANTDDYHFDTQVAVQCRALGVTVAQVPVPPYSHQDLAGWRALRYVARVLGTTIDYRLHQLHVVRRSRYLVDRGIKYRLKNSPYSSHGQILSLVPPGARVCDVGCGPGLLAEKLVEKKAQVVGFDVLEARFVSPAVKEYHQLNVEEGAPRLRRRFDVIVLADLIEHVRSPETLLQDLAKLLKPEGRLLVSTGNVAIWFYRLSLLFGRFNYGPRGILDKTHVHLYTLQTARYLVQSCGYRIRSVRYTVLPFEVVLESAKRSWPVRSLDFVYYLLVRGWPSLFAYQIVIEAELAGLDYASGEAQVDSRQSDAA